MPDAIGVLGAPVEVPDEDGDPAAPGEVPVPVPVPETLGV